MYEFFQVNNPRRVHLQDWQPQSREIVVEEQGLVEPLAWLRAGTLIYGALPRGKDPWYLAEAARMPTTPSSQLSALLKESGLSRYTRETVEINLRNAARPWGYRAEPNSP